MTRLSSAAVVAASTALAVTLTGVSASVAVTDQDDRALGGLDATLDVRNAGDAVRPTTAQLEAVDRIVRASTDGARVTYDDRFGTPRTIYPSAGTLTTARDGKAVDVARAWVEENRDAFGLTAAEAAALRVTRDHVLSTGTHVVGLRQVVEGTETVHGGSMTVVVRDNGAVESWAGQVARGTDLSGSWRLSPAEALAQVAGVLSDTTGFAPETNGEVAGYTTFAKGPFAAESYVKKAVFAAEGSARASYQVLFVEKLDEAYDVVVDAETGEILFRDSLVDRSESEGTVYENYPGAPGAGGEPSVKSFGPTDESPSGWVDPTGLAGLPGPTTFGNNANTYANWSNFRAPADQAPRPIAPDSHFNYVFENAWAESECTAVPPTYAEDIDPATTNLFYHHNRIHDEFYALGFTESGGNFQLNNGGAEGMSGDPVLGLAQAGAITGGAPLYTGRDNAYMLTLPDGIPPWSGMFLWEPINDTFEGPCRDGNFDAGVIEHEYAHGLTNRYVSEEDNGLGAHQSGAMGEGWGDWYALNYLHREGLTESSAVGAYATGNEDRGIRNWSYDDNPLTYGDVGYDITGAGVHADGEIWAGTLWRYRQALVEQFGQAKGSSIAARTVTDAMPRSPANPSMLDMRDAIALAIDDRYHDSPGYERIWDIFWTEFARRGMGGQASTEGGSDLDPVPSFDHQDRSRNGMLAGRVVNASTGKAVEDAKVIIGVHEAGVTPLRRTSEKGRFAAPVVNGTYPVTIQARGFGAQTFDGVEVAAGETTSLRFEVAPNLASEANGAELVSSSTPKAEALLDDTESSSWTTERRGNAVVKLGKEAAVSAVQVSAFTGSRFEALKDFTLQVSRDGKVWRNALVEKDAFGFGPPRPTTPDVRYRVFDLASPMQARFVRLYADAPIGETKESVQLAELQVYAGNVRSVTPTPPPPPDEPVTDTGTIAAGTPVGDLVDGGVTALDFQNTCTFPPGSQGSDAWVTELPDSFGDGLHQVEVTGTSAAPYDLDLYFYDADCQVTGSAASSAADAAGTLPSGTKYVLSHLWSGAAVDIEVVATDTE